MNQSRNEQSIASTDADNIEACIRTPAILLLLAAASLALMLAGCRDVNNTRDFTSDDVNVQVLSLSRPSDNADWMLELQNNTQKTYHFLQAKALCKEGTISVGLIESGRRVTLEPLAGVSIAMEGRTKKGNAIKCEVTQIKALAR